MGSMTPMLDDAARHPEHPTHGQHRTSTDSTPNHDAAALEASACSAGEALAVLEQAVAHLATCTRCRLDLSCVDGAALGEAAAWLWHAHHDADRATGSDGGA
jgi:hypothetical protein